MTENTVDANGFLGYAVGDPMSDVEKEAIKRIPGLIQSAIGFFCMQMATQGKLKEGDHNLSMQVVIAAVYCGLVKVASASAMSKDPTATDKTVVEFVHQELQRIIDTAVVVGSKEEAEAVADALNKLGATAENGREVIQQALASVEAVKSTKH